MRFKRIYVELSNICNLNCSFCSKDKRKKRSLSVEEFEHIIKQIKPYTNLIYLHVKGEPLLYKDIDKVFEITYKYKINLKITTNGIYLDKYIDLINKYSNIKQINISLMCENNDKNYLKKIFDIVDKIKTTIVFRVWLNNNQSNDVISMVLDHYKKNNDGKNIKLNEHIYLDKDIEFTWPNNGKSNYKNGICYGTRTHIGILSDGNVVPCCLDSDGILSFGNIFERNLNEIIESSNFIEFNNKIKNGIMPSDLCFKCDFKERLK